MWAIRHAATACTVASLRARAAWWARREDQDRWPRAPAYRKVFVVGCPRSGTTWIRRLIAGHSRVITGRESHAYPTVLGPFAEVGLAGDAGWRRVLHRYQRGRSGVVGIHRYATRRALLRLITAAMADPSLGDDERAAERVIQGIFDGYFVAHGGTSEHVLVEKTPRHLFWAERILDRYPEARVVEVLRDGRDVCVSMQMRSRTQSWSPSERSKQIRTWVEYTDRGMRLRAHPAYRGRVHLVRFEDVRADPQAQATQLLAFMGLQASSEQVHQWVDAVSIDRNPRRGKGRHARKGIVGDWRNHFSADDLALFERDAGEVFARAGYAL